MPKIEPLPAGAGAPLTAIVSSFDGPPSIKIRDPATLRTRHELMPREKAHYAMAWAVASNADWLALGRADGGVLLVDPRTGAQRALFPHPRDTVNWLRFSADGALLSASAKDGSLHVWSVPEGELLGQPLQLDDELWGHQLERHDDTATALTMHWDRVSMWGLAGAAQLAGAPVPLAPDITHPAYIPRFASAFDPAHALLATGGTEGSLRLWRLPPSPLRSALAATQREDELHFDGEHLVAVDGLRTWVFNASDQQRLSPIIELPKPVGFAGHKASQGDSLDSVRRREDGSEHFIRHSRLASCCVEHSPTGSHNGKLALAKTSRCIRCVRSGA